MLKLTEVTRFLIERDFLLAKRQFTAFINPFLFFILVVTLFPLTLSPEAHLLHEIAPGVIWTAALLANLLGLERLFREDHENGVLEQYLLSPYSLNFLLSLKIFIHWILINLPLILLTPLLCLLFHMNLVEMRTLMLSLLLGTPIFTLLGSIALALTITLPSSNLLLSLCVLPLTIPILIFGAGSVMSVGAGLSANSQLAFLAALLILSLTFIPLSLGYALRTGMN